MNKKPEFIRNIWDTEVNELSEIFDSNNDGYYLMEIANENNKEIPKFDLVKSKVFDNWLNKKLITKTKEKVNNIILSKNNKLSINSSIKRNSKSLGNLVDQNLISKIFEIKNNKLKLLVSEDKLVALKVIQTRTDNYKFDKKTYNDLNSNFSKSFFNDVSNYYVQHLALKHKLEKNFEELDNFFLKKENVN